MRAAIAFITLLPFLTGCSMLSPNTGSLSATSLDPAPGIDMAPPLTPSAEYTAYQKIQAAAANNAIVLTVQGDEKGARLIPLPTDGTPVYVSNLLQQTGSAKSFSKTEVALWRPAEQGGGNAKLKIRVRGGVVDPLTDYALRPGDRISVTESASTSWLSGVLDGLL